jgi:hypothetical protein
MQQPRQQYGLGSFVKKIGKKIKKVAKSPLGKAAIAIGIGSLIPGAGFMGKFNTAKNFLGGVGGYGKPGQGLLKKGFLGKLGLIEGKGSFKPTLLGKIAGIGLPSIIAGMGAGKPKTTGFSDSEDRREGLENYLRYYYSNLNPNAKQSEIDDFVKVNMYADGGRVNYAVGSGPMARFDQPTTATGERGDALYQAELDKVRAIAAPATPPKDLTRPVTELPGGGGGTTIPLPGPNRPGYEIGIGERRPIPGRQPGGPTGTPSPGRPIPEQSEGDKLYQDVLDYLKSDSNEPELEPELNEPALYQNQGFGKFTDLQRPKEPTMDPNFQNLSPQEQDAAMEKFRQGTDAFINRFGRFADGREIDPNEGRSSYRDILNALYTDYPEAFKQLKGDETLAELDNLGLKLGGYDTFDLSKTSVGSPGGIRGVATPFAAGGRIGYAEGGRKTFTDYLKNLGMDIEALDIDSLLIMQRAFERDEGEPVMSDREESAYGGRMGFAMGSKPEQNAIQAAGIEGLMLNQNPAGVTELDLRETGGFIPPVGAKEKADDIPAMLANNEFVFTADAVRGMGDGDVNEGAQRMYDMMKTLEKGGRV